MTELPDNAGAVLAARAQAIADRACCRRPLFPTKECLMANITVGTLVRPIADDPDPFRYGIVTAQRVHGTVTHAVIVRWDDGTSERITDAGLYGLVELEPGLVETAAAIFVATAPANPQSFPEHTPCGISFHGGHR